MGGITSIPPPLLSLVTLTHTLCSFYSSKSSRSLASASASSWRSTSPWSVSWTFQIRIINHFRNCQFSFRERDRCEMIITLSKSFGTKRRFNVATIWFRISKNKRICVRTCSTYSLTFTLSCKVFGTSFVNYICIKSIAYFYLRGLVWEARNEPNLE